MTTVTRWLMWAPRCVVALTIMLSALPILLAIIAISAIYFTSPFWGRRV